MNPNKMSESFELPKMKVTLTDGNEFIIKMQFGDMARQELLAARNDWPGMEKAKMLWMCTLTWVALRRMGKVPEGMDVESFIDRVESITDLDEEDHDDADDTPPW